MTDIVRRLVDGIWTTEAADAGGGGGEVPYVSGAGSPVDSVTPTAGKPLYIDTDDGGLYVATGPADTDWVAIGGIGNIGSATGLSFTNRNAFLLGGERDALSGTAYLGDAYSQWNGHSQGLQWARTGAEGDETLTVKTGVTGQHVGTLQNGSGNMTVPGSVTTGGNVDVAGNDLVNVSDITRTGALNVAVTGGAFDVDADDVTLGTGGTTLIQVGSNALGFFGETPAAKPSGVAVTPEAIHAALVTLGLIAA